MVLPLFTQDDVDAHHLKIPDWFWSSYEAFTDSVRKLDYPCYFGTTALRRRCCYYTPVDSNLPSDPEPLLSATKAFLQLAYEPDSPRRVLACFDRPLSSPMTLEEYETRFWAILQAMLDADQSRWPIERAEPTPNSRRFKYCLAGYPVFPIAATSSHLKRRSRNLGPGLCIVFIPYSAFEGVKLGTPAGAKARQVIRNRSSLYDELPEPPDFEAVDGQPYAWKAYFIGDSNEPKEGLCPLHVRNG